jgi:hypothetical protein
MEFLTGTGLVTASSPPAKKATTSQDQAGKAKFSHSGL